MAFFEPHIWGRRMTQSVGEFKVLKGFLWVFSARFRRCSQFWVRWLQSQSPGSSLGSLLSISEPWPISHICPKASNVTCELRDLGRAPTRKTGSPAKTFHAPAKLPLLPPKTQSFSYTVVSILRASKKATNTTNVKRNPKEAAAQLPSSL